MVSLSNQSDVAISIINFYLSQGLPRFARNDIKKLKRSDAWT